METCDAERLEIEQLLLGLSDAESSRERVERLEALLHCRQDLQHFYEQMVILHVLLACELDLTTHSRKPILPSYTTVRETIRGCSGEGHRKSRSNWFGNFSTMGRAARRQVIVAVAACAAIMFIGAWMFDAQRSGSNRSQALEVRANADDADRTDRPAGLRSDAADLRPEMADPRPELAVPRPELADPPSDAGESDELLVVRDVKALNFVSHLTRMASLASLQLPGKALANDSRVLTLCGGTAWMEHSSGQRGRGYILGLPPECRLKMYVDTNAAGQNALSIFELDTRGKLAGGAISFNNLRDVGEKRRRIKTQARGCIGNYADFNNGLLTRYYLLTASYNDQEDSVSGLWSQSDYMVQFLSDDVLVIGWDDTRYIPPRPGEAYGSRRDCDFDFNDVRAIAWLYDPDVESVLKNSMVDYSPAPTSSTQTTTRREFESGYMLEVRPGEVLVLIVSCSASVQSSIRISDVVTQHTVWEQVAPAIGNSKSSERTTHNVYVIRNRSNALRQYELTGSYKPAAADTAENWNAWPFKVLDSADGMAILGFTDDSREPTGADWPGVSVHARWFSN